MKAVEVRGLCKSYGKVKAVEGLDLDIDAGQVYGLLGPNGSGKTTAIKMLVGILRKDAGEAKVLGQPAGSRDYLKRIGYMPQETALYEELTVSANLRLFGRIYGLSRSSMNKRMDEVLSIVDLSDKRDAMFSTLSGGQKHRISLAASMVHSPELLFLDEPTVGVDPVLRANFWNTFSELKGTGMTIIMSTHYMDEARRCDNIGLMRSGKLIAEGRPKAILERTRTENLEDAFLHLVEKEAGK